MPALGDAVGDAAQRLLRAGNTDIIQADKITGVAGAARHARGTLAGKGRFLREGSALLHQAVHGAQGDAPRFQKAAVRRGELIDIQYDAQIRAQSFQHAG